VDQDAFRETYHDVNERACVFERAVLTHQCDCSQADRFCIAEREGVACSSGEGHARCATLVETLREQARFALREAPAEGGDALPYGKAMRVQVGGLRGIKALLERETDAPDKVEDVFFLVERALERYGSLAALPWSDIMPHIAAYRGRVRSRRRRT
jgi:hypothetical protein